MAPPFEPTRRLPGETFADWADRVRARTRGDNAAPADNLSALVGGASVHVSTTAPSTSAQPVPAPPLQVLPEVVAPRVAAAAEPTPDALIAAAQAEANARVLANDRRDGSASLRGLGAVAGFVVAKTKAAIGRVYHPKIWRADIVVPKQKRLAPRNWLRDIVAFYEGEREKGDPLAVSFKSCMGVMLFYANDARGFFQRAIRALSREALLSHETFRKCLRWAERHGWVGVLGANYREVDDEGVTRVRRDANVYQLFGAEDAAEFEGLDEAERVEKRVSLTLSRGMTLWGHHLWPWGLSSRSPSAPRDRRRRDPAPA